MKTRRLLRLGLAALAVSSGVAANDAPVRTLGSVTVLGTRPTSLPTQIPTTIEGVDAQQIADGVNATDAEDALKYLPSLNVRKRYIGDYDHAVLASRASGTNNSARSLVYADGILLSNLLGNGASFTPRWGMVTPEEIERVDVLYGPFSAAYPGNSVGAVVEYMTRMPDEFEGHARVASFGQEFSLYGHDDTYHGYQAAVSLGDRAGAWSWWANYNRLDSDGQALSFANKLASTTAASPTATPVTGAVPGKNPRNQDWLLIGATNQNEVVQDHAKVKVAYDFSPTLRASYMLGFWRNEATRRSESYLRDSNGTPIYGAIGTSAALPISIDGRSYSITPADFAPTLTTLEHFIHGLTLKSDKQGAFDWELAASVYDYATDEQRAPTIAVSSPTMHGAGRITSQEGTGWNTLSARTTYRPAGLDGAHLVEAGYQRSASKLRTRVHDTPDWIDGRAGARFSGFDGVTELHALFLQDTWRLAHEWRTTLGVRAERWQASDGRLVSATASQRFAERTETFSTLR